MSAIPILDFAISMIFLALIISLFVSWVIDYYASRLNKKGIFLQKMLIRLLGDDESLNWSSRFYRHPMIESLSIKPERLTSNIPPKLFGQVMADLIIEEGRDYSFTQDKETGEIEFSEEVNSERFLNNVKAGLDKIPESDLKRTINLFFEKAEGNTTVFIKSLDDWFEEYTGRIIHGYKRLLRLPMWILGFVIAFAFNIDSVQVTSELWNNAQMRKSIAAAASDFIEKNENLDDVELSKEFFKEYRTSLGLPVGWSYENDKRCALINEGEPSPWTFWFWVFKIFGFIITGMVASFGAPFWYDALQKIVGFKKSIKTE